MYYITLTHQFQLSMERTDLPVTLDIALQRGAKITIAESANTGMEMNHPVIASAHSSFF